MLTSRHRSRWISESNHRSEQTGWTEGLQLFRMREGGKLTDKQKSVKRNGSSGSLVPVEFGEPVELRAGAADLPVPAQKNRTARTYSFLRWGACCFCLLVLAGRLASAQVPSGAISGTVRDSSGAVVAGATVTVTSRETALVRTVQSGADGHYQLSSLPVGVYDIRSEAPGFQSQVQQNLNLAVGQEAVLNFSLTVGTVQETVTVTAEAPLVDTTSGSLGGLVSEKGVTELPLNGRSFNNLVLLQTGIAVHHPVSTTSSTSIGLAFSSNGAPIRSNYITLDGARLTPATAGITEFSTSGLMLGVDAIREFRVITNNFTAEYGMAMGSQMVIASKGGTNQFHGSVFDFLRNSKMDARNFFSRTNPPYHRNNLGGSLGGPVRKDKDFFFVSYEGVRELLGVPLLINVPNQRARTNGGLVPVVNPAVVPYLNLYPLPNGVLASDPAGNLGVGTYAFSFNQSTNQDFGQVRLDHTFSERNQLFVRYTVDASRKTPPNGNDPPPFQQNQNSRGHYITLAENHTFSAVVLNTIRASLTRPSQIFSFPPAPGTESLGFLPGAPLGSFGPGSGITAISGGSPTDTEETGLAFSDDFSWVKGKHSFKLGTLMNRYRGLRSTSNNPYGNYTFAGLQQFLAGNAQQFQTTTPGSITDRTWVWNTFGFYAQDEWRTTPRLTLNLGLRYEFQTEVNEVTGKAGSLRDMIRDASFTLGGPLYVNQSLKNLGPRFGFAWDVLGDGTTALRGGFGIFYDIAGFVPATDVEDTAPPFASQVLITSGLGFPSSTPVPRFNLNQNLVPIAGTATVFKLIEYRQGQPHMLSYNLTLERQLPSSMMISVRYAGSRGLNIIQTVDGNPLLPQVLADGTEFWPANARNRNPYWGYCECKTSGGDSWYNSLQMSLQRRMTRNLQFQASYTFAKLLDDTQGLHGGEAGGSSVTGTDPFHLKTDKGPADFNSPHYFAFNALYSLPASGASGLAGGLVNGWRLGTILTIDSGLPFSPLLSGNRSRSGVLGGGSSNPDRPNWVPGCSKLIRGGPNQYFNPACFTVQTVGFLGNVGRGIMMGPLHATWDFSLMKDTRIRFMGEGGHLEFRAEFFNLLNRADFNIPTDGRTVFTATPTTASVTPLASAGQISSTIGSARQIQFALKLIF